MRKFYTSAILWGDNVLVRGYDDDGAFSKKIHYKPKLFVPAKNKSDASWSSIEGQPLEPIEFDSVTEAKNFIDNYKNVTGFPIYGFSRYEYAWLNEEYRNEVVYDIDRIRVANIDIEVYAGNGFPNVNSASEEITAITLKKDKIFYVFGCNNYEPERQDVKYIHCKNERHLLMAFLDEWERYGAPDILTGWNISFFDIPYLVNRIRQVLDEKECKRLSPWKHINEKTTKFMGKEHILITIVGVAVLDYLEMYKKFTYTQQESYRLDHIAFTELGEKKLDFHELGYETIHEFYENDFTNYINYNIRDVELVDKLDDKMKLIEMVLTLAYDAKVNMADTFTQVKMWDVIIHNHLYKKKIAIPLSGGGHKSEQFIGAYVKDPQIGSSDWVMSFDLNSLYPHLIMQYNISPETMLKGKKADISIDHFLSDKPLPLIDGYCLAPNGSYFKNDKQGFLPEIMERLYADRTIYKEKMIVSQKKYELAKTLEEKKKYSKEISRFKNMQLARKVQLNSAFGALGNQYFRFFDIDQATAITMGGQLAIRWAENHLNIYINRLLKTNEIDYVIASDTDSLYITFSGLVRSVFKDRGNTSKERIVEFLDRVAHDKFEPVIDDIYQRLAKRCSAFQQKMNMKREVIADRGIWTAKKRYILNVYDSEGVRYEKPKLKMMGVETVKSSTPSSCRVALTESLNIIMNNSEERMQEYIREFKKKFKSLPFEDISFPRSVQNVQFYSKETKAIPIAVRGAITFNKALKDFKLTKKYESIRDGEKIKYCYMKMPNPLQENILSIVSFLPKEFKMNAYIDYDLQFEKAFLDPLRSILNVIHWKEEPVASLENFF